MIHDGVAASCNISAEHEKMIQPYFPFREGAAGVVVVSITRRAFGVFVSVVVRQWTTLCCPKQGDLDPLGRPGA